jgi:putative membrane protein
MPPRQERASKLLVLCVDRDDDVGTKAMVRTPVVGREACAKIASSLAIADPEEADANAIFAAIKVHDDIVRKGYASEVAVVAGRFEGGVEADEKLRREMLQITDAYSADGVILVTDGAEDKEVLPILQGIIPVVSVKRVVIKHSAGVEETYEVLGRYLRMVIYDPRYSKFFLGLPGVLIFAWAILAFLGRITEATTISLGILGVAFIIKGFNLDKHALSLAHIKPSGYVRLFSALAAILSIAAGFFQGFARIGAMPEFAFVTADPGLFFRYGTKIFGEFLFESLNTIWIGLGLFFGGGFLVGLIRRRRFAVLRSTVALVALAFMYLPVQQFSLLLRGVGNTFALLSMLLMGLAAIFVVITLVYQHVRERRAT